VEFTWDERKNRVNQRKHRVSFETAIRVFERLIPRFPARPGSGW